MTSRTRTRRTLRRGPALPGPVGALALALAVSAALAAPPSPASGASVASVAPVAASAEEGDDLYLVTLRTPGAATPGMLPTALRGLQVLASQRHVLAAVGSPEPVYRYTSALNGFAVRLDAAQATALAALPAVLAVEADSVRPVAATGTTGTVSRIAAAAASVSGPRRGGAGVVVGVVDTGVEPDSPVFALRGTGSTARGFTGSCDTAADWDVAECTGKLVAAHSYVEGFGTDRLRAASIPSPRDADGHGTRTASIAVGNARVPVVVRGERVGRFGGQAPDAALAVYKACWSAPDPRDDGCSAADLVAAVDEATREGVDVLTLAVGGPSGIDVVERALLGATESGVVVVAAAGNDGTGAPAHVAPWVVTAGGTAGDVRRGRVVLPDGTRLGGAMFSRQAVGPTRVVLGADAAASGSTSDDARVCAPGSLDAAVVGGAVVVCERGRVGRVDKSRAVDLADGVAMVLVNAGPGSVDADVHDVPTVHLARSAGRRLERWLRTARTPRVALRPLGVVDRRTRVASFSGSGDSGTGAVKPDVLAPATAVLAAVPADLGSWDVASGTSAAAAHVSGVAAVLLGRGMSPAEVRSALVTTARPLRRDPVLRGGGGLVRARDARRPGLAVLSPPGAYREWLDRGRQRLNTPSILLDAGQLTARRRITNVTGRRLYFSSSAVGFRRDVTVTPAAVRLGPGESATFRVRVQGRRGGPVDDGYVVWRGATGTVTRIPVVLTR